MLIVELNERYGSKLKRFGMGIQLSFYFQNENFKNKNDFRMIFQQIDTRHLKTIINKNDMITKIWTD